MWPIKVIFIPSHEQWQLLPAEMTLMRWKGFCFWRFWDTNRRVAEIESDGIDCQFNGERTLVRSRVESLWSLYCSGMEQRRRGWPTDAKHRSKSRWMAKFIDSVCTRGAIAREPLNPLRYRSTEELAGRTIIVELYNCIQFRCYLGVGCWIYYVIHDVHGPYSCWMTTTTTKMDRRRGVQSVL